MKVKIFIAIFTLAAIFGISLSVIYDQGTSYTPANLMCYENKMVYENFTFKRIYTSTWHIKTQILNSDFYSELTCPTTKYSITTFYQNGLYSRSRKTNSEDYVYNCHNQKKYKISDVVYISNSSNIYYKKTNELVAYINDTYITIYQSIDADILLVLLNENIITQPYYFADNCNTYFITTTPIVIILTLIALIFAIIIMYEKRKQLTKIYHELSNN